MGFAFGASIADASERKRLRKRMESHYIPQIQRLYSLKDAILMQLFAFEVKSYKNLMLGKQPSFSWALDGNTLDLHSETTTTIFKP